MSNNNNNTLIISSKTIFEQMLKNIKKEDSNNELKYENIYAKDLKEYDFIKIDYNDEEMQDILQLIEILNKELDKK